MVSSPSCSPLGLLVFAPSSDVHEVDQELSETLHVLEIAVVLSIWLSALVLSLLHLAVVVSSSVAVVHETKIMLSGILHFLQAVVVLSFSLSVLVLWLLVTLFQVVVFVAVVVTRQTEQKKRQRRFVVVVLVVCFVQQQKAVVELRGQQQPHCGEKKEFVIETEGMMELKHTQSNKGERGKEKRRK